VLSVVLFKIDVYRWNGRRWAKNHTDDLQAAFFNADGFESWENVWGIWNGLTPRDAEATRRVATILRFLSSIPLLPGEYSLNLTQSPYWMPHFPTVSGYLAVTFFSCVKLVNALLLLTCTQTNNHSVFASAWPTQPILFTEAGVPNVTSTVAFTLVNRDSEDSNGFQLSFAYPYNPTYEYAAFDLVRTVVRSKVVEQWRSVVLVRCTVPRHKTRCILVERIWINHV
jgi:hypothetical protein